MSSNPSTNLTFGDRRRSPVVDKNVVPAADDGNPGERILVSRAPGGNKADDFVSLVRSTTGFPPEHPVIQFLSSHVFMDHDALWATMLSNYAKVLNSQRPSGAWKNDLRGTDELREALGFTAKDQVPIYVPFCSLWLSQHPNLVKEFNYSKQLNAAVNSVRIGDTEFGISCAPDFLQSKLPEVKAFFDAFGTVLSLDFNVRAVPQEAIGPIAALYYSKCFSVNYSNESSTIELKHLWDNTRVPVGWGETRFFQPSEFDAVMKEIVTLVRGAVHLPPFPNHLRLDSMQCFVHAINQVDPGFKKISSIVASLKGKMPPKPKLKPWPADSKTASEAYEAAMAQLDSSRIFRASRPSGDSYTKGFGSVYLFNHELAVNDAISLVNPISRCIKFVDDVVVRGDPEPVAMVLDILGAKQPIVAYGAFTSHRENVVVRNTPLERVGERTLLVDLRDFSSTRPLEFYNKQDARFIDTAAMCSGPFILYGKLPESIAKWVAQPVEINSSEVLRGRPSYGCLAFPGPRPHNGYVYLTSFPDPLEPDDLILSMLSLGRKLLEVNVERDYAISVGLLYPGLMPSVPVNEAELFKLNTFLPYSMAKGLKRLKEKVAVKAPPADTKALVDSKRKHGEDYVPVNRPIADAQVLDDRPPPPVIPVEDGMDHDGNSDHASDSDPEKPPPKQSKRKGSSKSGSPGKKKIKEKRKPPVSPVVSGSEAEEDKPKPKKKKNQQDSPVEETKSRTSGRARSSRSTKK